MENFKWEKSNEIDLPKHSSRTTPFDKSKFFTESPLDVHEGREALEKEKALTEAKLIKGYNELENKSGITQLEEILEVLEKEKARVEDQIIKGHNGVDKKAEIARLEGVLKDVEDKLERMSVSEEPKGGKVILASAGKDSEPSTPTQKNAETPHPAKSPIENGEYVTVNKGVVKQVNPARLINVSMKDFESNKKNEDKLVEEAKKIEKEIEAMPEEEKKKTRLGLLNLGFYATKLKSDAMAWICDKAIIGSEKPIQEQGAVRRFLSSLAETYKKDSEKAQKQIESPSSVLSLKSASSVGQITGGILKWGRTVSDVASWTAGSPLRYVMAGAQFFSRGAEAVKEARLINEEVIEKTRVKDTNEAADQAWKIYEQAKIESEKSGQKEISKESLEAVYVKNLPQDLLERLKKTGPGTATGILQWILKKDLEIAIKRGQIKIGEDGRIEKFFEGSFNNRLKEYDRMIGQYGEVDALAMGAKYAETTGKAVIAGVQIETAALLIQRLPEMLSKLSHLSVFEHELPKELKVTMYGKVLTGEELHKIAEQKLGAIKLEASGIAEKLELEKAQAHLTEIAKIKQGEGIEHALIRQLNDSPQKFGFHGDINNETEREIWANNEAHRIAIRSGDVNLKTGEETWIRGGKEKPTFVILQDDKTIKFENADLYKHLSAKPEITSEISHEELVKPGVTVNYDVGGVHQTPLHTELVGDTTQLANDLNKMTSEELQRQMETPEGKLNGLLVSSRAVRVDGLEDFLKRQGGIEKLLKMPVRELYGIEQGYPRPVQLDRLYEGLQNITGDARLDSNDTLEDVLKSIESKSIFHGTAREILGEGIHNSFQAESIPVIDHTMGTHIKASAGTHLESEVSTSAHTEAVAPPHTLMNEVITTKEGIKGIFSYDSSGKITGIKPEGFMSPLQGKVLLKDNYEELMKNKGAKLFDIQSMETSALGLSQREQILKTLEESGQGKSDKAEFLRKIIKNTTDQIESKYGKIFK